MNKISIKWALCNLAILCTSIVTTSTAETNIHHDNDNSSTNLRLTKETTPSKSSRDFKQDHRIAILVPFLSNSHPILPTYFPLFLQSVGGLSPLIDVFIFHNGQLAPLIHYESSRSENNHRSETTMRATIMDMEVPQNIQFINLQNMTHFANELLQVMNVKRQNETEQIQSNLFTDEEYEEISYVYQLFIAQNPYLLIEVKPALGYIFRKYIPQSKYSHWGYSDLDVYFGDLQSWITPEELNEFDIVTYGFGDQNRVYLRGQFTFHKNDVEEDPVSHPETKEIYKIWTKCHYLYHLDTRIMRFIKQRKFYLQSAEGCYSSAVMSSSEEKKLKVKYAVKAWTNPSSNAGMNEYGVSAVFINGDDNHDHYDSQQYRRSIVFKKTHSATGSEYLKMLSKIHSQSVFNSTSQLPSPMQWDVGEMEPVTTKDGLHCMKWAPKEHQSNLCIDSHHGVGNSHTVYLIDGKLFKRKFEERSDLFFVTEQERGEDNHNNNEEKLTYPVVESRPIFHVQEWKRSYRSTQLSSMKIPKGNILGWTFYPEGAVPILDKKATKPKNQIKMSETYNLPSQEHCFLLKKEKHKGQFKDYCKWAVSWYDGNLVKMEGSAWSNPENRKISSNSITLLLTLQITTLPDESVDVEELESMLKAIKTNIVIWKNQPWILCICIVGSESQSTSDSIIDELKRHIDNVGSTNYLIGIIASANHVPKDDDGNVIPISRKALMNLGESASYTRWTISGLDIENNRSILSVDALQFAERAVSNQLDNNGHVFVIPDFYVADEFLFQHSDKAISISEFHHYHNKGAIAPNSFYNGADEVEKKNLITNFQDALHSLWLSYSVDITSSLDTISEATASSFAEKLDNIHLVLSQLISDDYVDEIKQSSNIILMIDKFSPANGISTPFLATEIDELGGCYNVMRLVQLALLNYHIQPLMGMFSISSKLRNSKNVCNSADSILKEERTRIAKFMILNNA